MLNQPYFFLLEPTEIHCCCGDIKAAPWDDINFCFQFRTEVVYPTDHVFIFF